MRVFAKYAGTLLTLFLISSTCVCAQNIKPGPNTDKPQFKAGWIGPPDVQLTNYGIYHFRKTLHLATRPADFIIHISADNRYQLYVNGTAVASGPQRSDVSHWRYETIDLAPYLKTGENIIAATVWNQGENAAWAQLSLQTGLLIDGVGTASIANSDTSWRVTENFAYAPIAIGLHITGPFEQIYAQRFPWGWELSGYDDRYWKNAIETEKAIAFNHEKQQGRQLLERNIAMVEEVPQRFKSVRRAEGILAGDEFIKGTKPLEVIPHSNVTLLLDQGALTNAYPELLVSGGRDCKITLTYTEALYANSDGQKANRNEIDGKTVKGNQDVFILDGGAMRLFRPLYYRTFRYVEVKIENHQFPLTINSFSSSFTAYPFAENASFNSSDISLEKIWNVGWRTSRLCAYDTYMDCPYYEQLQYIGDTRIQALISLYVSGDDRLMKNAITQFDQSRIAEGLTQSRYPSGMKQIIPPFSLFWIAMLHDYRMLGSDEQFVENLLPGVAEILNWHEQYISEQGMLSKMPFWNFVDWPKEWPWKGNENVSGVPESALTGNSAVLTLQYVYALNYAEELYRSFGLLQQAKVYETRAKKLVEATYKACWDRKREMMADSPDKGTFSQHTNAMAVLAGAIPLKDRKALLLKIEGDPDIIQCTIYYRFYMIQAFKKAGLGKEYLRLLKPWNQMLDLGLSTFAERPEPTRSDCHGWSASPNYDLLATVCGITPLKPGFKQVRIAPELGSLTWVEAAMPHPLGEIKMRLENQGGFLTGVITLPNNLNGEFIWHHRTIKLKPGIQKIGIKSL
ncbi:family 78 glycoside hydrolase catalytic domain [Pedobacter metabolipauper]|uniref:Alpha-L-rhamnosidase-like protein n=1 Tax=Pedobacter metabolipauper TaxID=425513 RepID=A0A4V3D123_9SPHI|nr:family 78 glycoside hydrolase catalytic domain [Pedobacter metabolipauper]TDQ08664.1 alpha-L-rhamnosidase-like protein [Pedobacter metabolipauper]